MLLLGIGIMIMQVRKYYYGTLEMKWEELIVFAIACFMILNPLSLIELTRTVINTKYGKGSNE